jgi:hypothetical protein
VSQTLSIPDIDRVYLERHADNNHACDVILKTKDGTIYTALFVTLQYLRRQMEINYHFSKQVEGAAPLRFAALDVPHILIEKLDREVIEDAIDTLVAMDTFECMFTRVTEVPEDERATSEVKEAGRTTQEVAAVVLQEVLVVTG